MAGKSRIRADRDVGGTQSKIAKGRAEEKLFGGKKKARGKVDSLGPIEGAPDGKGTILLPIGAHGPKLDRVKYHCDTILGLKKRVREFQGKLSKAWDAAEVEGIHKKGTKDMMKLLNDDPIEVKQHLTAMYSTAEAMGMDVGTQSNSNISRAAHIFDQGFKDGALAKSPDDAPWKANTPEGQTYLQGYGAGQASIFKIGKSEESGADKDEDGEDDTGGQPKKKPNGDEASGQAAH